MRILILSMPDTAEVIDSMTRLPNLATVTLAGQLINHDVKVLDLVVHKPRIRTPIEKAIRSFRPKLIGLSAMTFQFDTLLRVARFIRSIDSSILIVAGGYHVTLLAKELSQDPTLPLDFMVRGEGEATMTELADALENNTTLSDIQGLSFHNTGGWTHNPKRPLLDTSTIKLPNRNTRTNSNYYYLGMPMDVIETSRGCPFNCKFCSITNMYGHTFRPFSEERIVADLWNIRKNGAKAILLVDDNITCAPDHFRMVCRAIVKNGLNDMLYAVQASATGLANNPDIVEEMDKANFRTVFVGFESMIQTNLKDMQKPTNPDINRITADLLHKHNMGIIAGIIVGYPDDTRETIAENMRLFKELKPDAIYAQYLTPYPKTKLREEMLEAGLVTNKDDFSLYDGFTCNVRTKHMTSDELFRTLKKEAMAFSLSFSQISQNYFLRNHALSLLKSVVKTTYSDIFNILTAKRYAAKFDV
ncbi:MAG: radical SAM protein [Kiritimatiellae bacterium]|nr:radical SAM protein [Kiritimatiellia bacterium]MDD5521691.1 radical SAM protein [Kiritimatiellia bacterium]